jgi:hypothetical protein
MALRLRSLLLVFACAPYLPAAHGTERAGDAICLYELEQHANAVAALQTEFLSLIEVGPGEERFYLYWTYNHLMGSWSQVEHMQTQLEFAIEAQSYSDEDSIRATLRDQARFVRWELGYAVDDLELAIPDVRPLSHYWVNEVRSLLLEVRATVDGLLTDQCAIMRCAESP